MGKMLYICILRTKRYITELLEDSERACAKIIESTPNSKHSKKHIYMTKYYQTDINL